MAGVESVIASKPDKPNFTYHSLNPSYQNVAIRFLKGVDIIGFKPGLPEINKGKVILSDCRVHTVSADFQNCTIRKLPFNVRNCSFSEPRLSVSLLLRNHASPPFGPKQRAVNKRPTRVMFSNDKGLLEIFRVVIVYHLFLFCFDRRSAGS